MCVHKKITRSKLVLINHVIIGVKLNNNSVGDRRSCVIFICPCKLQNCLISYIYLFTFRLNCSLFSFWALQSHCSIKLT